MEFFQVLDVTLAKRLLKVILENAINLTLVSAIDSMTQKFAPNNRVRDRKYLPLSWFSLCKKEDSKLYWNEK